MIRPMHQTRPAAARLGALMAAACTSLTAAAAPESGGPALPPALAAGVHCNGGAAQTGALFVFAGWTVQAAHAWTWLQALRPAAGVAPGALLCAVAGPQDSSYRRKDIATDALARHLAAAPAGTAPVIVIAHSSGSFVAQQGLQQLRDLGATALLGRIRYYNLDGAVGSEERAIDAAMVQALAEVHAVYAVDAAGAESANAAPMRALHALAPDRVRLHALTTPGAGCNANARWCLHQTLVTRRPHDPQRFDLARDYGQLSAERPVQDDYLRRP
jgi:hypothetical protein